MRRITHYDFVHIASPPLTSLQNRPERLTINHSYGAKDNMTPEQKLIRAQAEEILALKEVAADKDKYASDLHELLVTTFQPPELSAMLPSQEEASAHLEAAQQAGINTAKAMLDIVTTPASSRPLSEIHPLPVRPVSFGFVAPPKVPTPEAPQYKDECLRPRCRDCKFVHDNQRVLYRDLIPTLNFWSKS